MANPDAMAHAYRADIHQPRRNLPVGDGPVAVIALASQLLWADAAYVLSMSDALDEPGPWTLCSFGVTAVSFWLALSRRSPVMAVLSSGGFMVASISGGAG